MKWLWRSAIGWGLTLQAALAFEIGGHHDTLNVLLHAAAATSPASPANLRESRIIGFCAWLPDLSADLDAAILRLRVLWDTNDRRWGLASKCDTNSSHQMAVAQTYLHALTGGQVQPAREAAKDLVRHFKAPQPGEDPLGKETRLCALGFSLHLLGDTFAHSRLIRRPWQASDTPSRLYDTGRGHAEDGSEPDYMLRRTMEPRVHKGHEWSDWIQTLAELWSLPADYRFRLDPTKHDDVVRELLGRPGSAGEQELTRRLLGLAPDWRVMPEAGASWPQPSKWHPDRGPFCRDQLTRQKGTWPRSLQMQMPDCHEAWRSYLLQAERIFRAKGVDPLDSSCKVRTENGRVTAPTLD